MSFSLTHNPLFQVLIIPGIVTFICGPFLGGFNAGGRIHVGAFEAFVVAFTIGVVNGIPVGAAWLLFTLWPDVLPDPALVIQVRAVVGWIALTFAIYGGLTAFAGAILAERRKQPWQA